MIYSNKRRIKISYLIYRKNNNGRKDCLFIIKIEVWYVIYDEDVDILNHLFGYKMIYFKSYRKVCFPKSRITLWKIC